MGTQNQTRESTLGNPLGREMDALTVAWVDVPFPLGPFVQGLTKPSDETSRV